METVKSWTDKQSQADIHRHTYACRQAETGRDRQRQAETDRDHQRERERVK